MEWKKKINHDLLFFFVFPSLSVWINRYNKLAQNPVHSDEIQRKVEVSQGKLVL